MKINLKSNLVPITILIFLILFCLGLQGILFFKSQNEIRNMGIVLFNTVLLLTFIAIIINLFFGIFYISSLKSRGQYFVELDFSRNYFHLVDIDKVMMGLLYIFNEKVISGKISEINRVELKRISNTDTKVLIFFIMNKEIKLRITNKMIEESEFNQLLAFLSENKITIIE